MTQPPRKKLSAIIACYRDAPAVPIMHGRLTAVFNKLGVDYEIIFVNDNSPDNAREVDAVCHAPSVKQGPAAAELKGAYDAAGSVVELYRLLHAARVEQA